MLELHPETIIEQWRKTLSAVERLGGDARELQIERPATEDEIVDVERQLGVSLPVSFRHTLLTFSRAVDMSWYLPDDFDLPDEFTGIFSGNMHWSLEVLLKFERMRQDWVRVIFPDPNDPFDRHWHDKLAIYAVGNGDWISIDLRDSSLGEIVYLSHDDGEANGYRMASSFAELVLSWSRIGCVGGEDWQWLPFYDHSRLCINSEGDPAARFRKLIGLSLDQA
ncbi:MAG: hypothetical protein MnENMB40S_25070 [Rhizobiaceae bacterium MnEN-MB40S]|nr:MAG: hypothetical protein MnENMB40S_25070 [Rhizobiaceae bacterium MnEN-MB40S]